MRARPRSQLDIPTQERAALDAGDARGAASPAISRPACAGHYRVKRPHDRRLGVDHHPDLRRARPDQDLHRDAARGRPPTAISRSSASRTSRPRTRNGGTGCARNADRVITADEPFNWSRFNNLAARARRRANSCCSSTTTSRSSSPTGSTRCWSRRSGPRSGWSGRGCSTRTAACSTPACSSPRWAARHAFRYAAEDDPGYFGLALTAAQRHRRDRRLPDDPARHCSTRSAASTRRTTIINNDLDFCLRAWQRGLRVVYTPHATLIHHEVASRGERSTTISTPLCSTAHWRDAVRWPATRSSARTSPRHRDDFVAEREPAELVCRRPAAVRRAATSAASWSSSSTISATASPPSRRCGG